MSEENKTEETETPKSFTQADIDKIISDKNDEMAGLKTNHDKLLGEKKDAQRLKEEADASARLAVEESAKTSKNFEEFEASINERHSLALNAEIEKNQKFQNSFLGSEKKALVNDLKNDFVDSSKLFGEMSLNNMIDVSFNESGKQETTYKKENGEVLTTDPVVFKEYLNGNSAFQSHLKGVQLSGGGQRSENNSGGATKTKLNKTELSQLANSDPVKYQNYIKSQGE